MKQYKSLSKALAILLSFSIFHLLFGVVSFLLIRPYIEYRIRLEFAVTEKSVIYDMWLNPPVHPIMKLSVFNVTNLEAWLEGTDEEMNVQEVGPFVYR